jgi:hypothetical protein
MKLERMGFDPDVQGVCSDELARMLRRCRTRNPKIDGRILLANLLWTAHRFYEYMGPIETAVALERAAMHALCSIYGYEPDEIDEVLGPARAVMHDIAEPKKADTPMRRTKWPKGRKVIPFPPRTDDS